MSDLPAQSFDAAIEPQLRRYLERLLETNRSFNLTAITDPEEAWSKHILDSLTLLPELQALPAGAQVADVGSGGGLPAVPLAIAFPHLQFTLLEATAKKARFLEQTAHELGLTNVRVRSERVEVIGRGPDRERYAAVTSRAVSRLPVLLELTIPLLVVGGVSLAIKGEQAEIEIQEAARALSLLRASVEHVQRTRTGVIVRIRKREPTPGKYPRRPGDPQKAPL